MVDIEAGAIVVSAHLGMPWQNITGSMNIPSGDCMDKIAGGTETWWKILIEGMHASMVWTHESFHS